MPPVPQSAAPETPRFPPVSPLTRDKLNVGHRQFAGMTVRFSDGGCVQDVRKLQQRLFNQGWIDIVAAADDDVLGAAGDKDEPILVDATEIAADQPAILGAGHPSRARD